MEAVCLRKVDVNLLSLCLIKHNAMKTYGERRYSSIIIDLDIGRR
jgi:hypothetical protein